MTHPLKAWTVALSLSLAGIAAAEEPAYVHARPWPSWISTMETPSSSSATASPTSASSLTRGPAFPDGEHPSFHLAKLAPPF